MLHIKYPEEHTTVHRLTAVRRACPCAVAKTSLANHDFDHEALLHQLLCVPAQDWRETRLSPPELCVVDFKPLIAFPPPALLLLQLLMLGTELRVVSSKRFILLAHLLQLRLEFLDSAVLAVPVRTLRSTVLGTPTLLQS